ncbi:MAG: hypothetical protein EBZ40_12320 [Gammaproteobacteria bacterium]|nr:hypothetical protein [Gammaproteobacteria bacterium]
MECYSLELVHEASTGGDSAPMLPSVPRAYILTMHDRETFPWLHGVARSTYVQRNRGFRACPKTRGDGRRVDATNQDIIHSYRAVFERERDTTDPVLVFEDDARLTSTAKEDLEIVDRFVATHKFSVYSLGSFGLMVPHDNEGNWRFLGSVFAFTQAVIYSPLCVRAILGATDVGPREHIDSKILGAMSGKFTYHRPIAYQVFDARNKSENSKTWCIRCDGSALDSALNDLNSLYQGALGLDKEPGWHKMYGINKLVVPVGILVSTLVVVLVGLLVVLIARRRMRARSRTYP